MSKFQFCVSSSSQHPIIPLYTPSYPTLPTIFNHPISQNQKDLQQIEDLLAKKEAGGKLKKAEEAKVAKYGELLDQNVVVDPVKCVNEDTSIT